MIEKKKPKTNGKLVKRRTAKHTDAEIERGLVALGLVNGNSRRAARLLGEQGFKIWESTLRKWRDRYPDRYRQLQQDTLPELREQLAELHTDLAHREIELSGKLAARLEKTYKQLEPRDLSTAIRNADVGSGIHTQRAQELRGEPNIRVRHERDAGQILRQLRELGMPLPRDVETALDSTAEEITEDDEQDDA